MTYEQALKKAKKLEQRGFRLTRKMINKIIKRIGKN